MPLRLLIVSYYFPPSGGAGVQRVLKWVKYLPEHGIEPTVLTVRAGAFPEIDKTLLDDIPDGVEVVRTVSADPFGLYARLTGRPRGRAISERTDEVGSGGSGAERAARWLRANLFIPDARVGWVPFATARGAMLCRKRPIDAILTSGPPHSTHLVGGGISRIARIPWIADLRDPWTDIHYYADLPRSRPAARADAFLERRVLTGADAVVTVSSSWGELLSEKSGRDVDVVHNGFDPDDFLGPAPPKDRTAFTVAHIGSLFGARNPTALWQALDRFAQLGSGGSLRIRLVGRVSEDVARTAAARGLQVERHGYVTHAEAVAEMRSADLLVLSSEHQTAQAGHIPGKLFEYLASGNPILGLGDPRGDAARIIESVGAGRVFERDDVDGIQDFVQRHYRTWEQGGAPAVASRAAVESFSRRRQAGDLAKLIRNMVVSSQA